MGGLTERDSEVDIRISRQLGLSRTDGVNRNTELEPGAETVGMRF